MKKRDLERRIVRMCRDAGVELHYVGGTNHDKYRINGVMITVPRHSEIKEFTAWRIITEAERAIQE
jgi:hypothetical protein